jgi:hypothetical protein
MAKHVQNTPDHQAIKRESGALVRAVGGVEAADGYCRSGYRRLSEYGRPDNDCFMPVDVVLDLEAVAHDTLGYPQVTRFLARRAGFALVPLPRPGGVSAADLHAALAEAMTESAELHTRLIGALGDGKVGPAQAQTLAAEALDDAEAVMRLHALLRQIAEA